MSDLINRKDAIDACHNWDDGENAYAYGDIVMERLQALPSAERTGHWIEHENPKDVFSIECSECGCWFLHEHLVRNSFCPNCGAKMDEREEEQ